VHENGDKLFGEAGNDVLSGGVGADRFVFDGPDLGLDLISDFGNGDVLAIGGMLTGFAAGREAEFVNLLDDGTDTTVQVDADGALNGSAFESIAVLSGLTGTTLSSLTSAGKLDFWLS
jgi:Ca2+-binding RTX toxin-like protein